MPVGFMKPMPCAHRNPCPWLGVRVAPENPRVARDIPYNPFGNSWPTTKNGNHQQILGMPVDAIDAIVVIDIIGIA